MNRSIRLRLVTFLGLVFALTAAIWLAWWWPKSCPLQMNVDYFTGYYRGFGLGDQPGFFGKNYFAVRFTDTKEIGGVVESRFLSHDKARFVDRFVDGRLRAEGECRIEWLAEPDPDFSYGVLNAKYYDPQGKLASEIVDGTGVQTYWAINGVKVWERTVKQGKTTELRRWSPTGEDQPVSKEYWPK
ncbi:MAG: hypothetical protein SGJ19_20285 [Planctomycetia bacterium]|nr:hypothetical protein [Planctomycetia bacterium]